MIPVPLFYLKFLVWTRGGWRKNSIGGTGVNPLTRPPSRSVIRAMNSLQC